MGVVKIIAHLLVYVRGFERMLSDNGNLLELNEIGTGEQQPHGFEWSEE